MISFQKQLCLLPPFFFFFAGFVLVRVALPPARGLHQRRAGTAGGRANSTALSCHNPLSLVFLSVGWWYTSSRDAGERSEQSLTRLHTAVTVNEASGTLSAPGRSHSLKLRSLPLFCRGKSKLMQK